MNARDAQDWGRLASYIRNRRVEFGWDRQSDLAHAARVSLRTITTVENGRRVWPATLSKIENALRWKPGSTGAVLNGGEPELVDEALQPTLTDPHERAIWELSDLDAETRWSLINHLRERQKRATG